MKPKSLDIVDDRKPSPEAAEAKEWAEVATKPRSGLSPALQALEDMKRASAQIDESEGTMDYQVGLVALAMIARQYLRELAAAGSLEAALAAPGGSDVEKESS